jgi:predicted nucleic acid-binding protein
LSKIFFDTNAFIYMFEGADPLKTQMREIRMRMIARGDQLVTSAMTLGEVLVKPVKTGHRSLGEQYDRAIRTTAKIVSFDPSACWRYATLRATHNLRNADAIQLSCAAQFGVDLFITNDKQLHKLNIPGIGFITPLERVPL